MITKALATQCATVHEIVSCTIQAIYPQYYSSAVVDFFLNHHNKADIEADILDNKVYLLSQSGEYIGTGTIDGAHMTRVFILPKYQRQGKGSLLMNFLEEQLSKTFSKICLDASFPAFNVYIKRGYRVIAYHEKDIGEGKMLCYSVMQKDVHHNQLHNKIFRSINNTETGEVTDETIFNYHEQDGIVWADYAGGKIQKGFLIGKYVSTNTIKFTYQHINHEGDSRLGKCESLIAQLVNGKLRLNESWQWLDTLLKGTSIIEEI